MALFRYKAINDRGHKVAGQLTANNEADLFQRLRAMNLELVSAAEESGKKRRSLFAAKIKTRDLIQVCLHLQQLLGAGVGMMESLADVRDSVEQRSLRDLIAEILQDVAEGKSLSEAFGRHPAEFGTVFQSLIAAGEESGNLPESFAQLIKHLKWTDEVSAKVKKATRYPMFMVVVMLGLFFFMMIWVVPQVVGFLGGNGQELPLMTTSLIATSNFVQDFWWAMIGLPVGTLIGAKVMARSSDDVAYRADYLALRLPLIGNLLRKITLSRFAHFFATMFRSGVPILTCLATAQKVVANRCLARSLANVLIAVQDGNSLSSGLKDTGEFPSLVIRMVKIGEDSGNLGDTLANVTEFYDRDVNDNVDAMVAMIEPCLTIFSGAMMAWIIAAVLGPIYDSLSKMGG